MPLLKLKFKATIEWEIGGTRDICIAYEYNYLHRQSPLAGHSNGFLPYLLHIEVWFGHSSIPKRSKYYMAKAYKFLKYIAQRKRHTWSLFISRTFIIGIQSKYMYNLHSISSLQIAINYFAFIIYITNNSDY